ncbi:MAG TPA: divalent metal cation transporter [Chitinophagaceae bacterium]|nr:divalent metal cation transporter [Chitinophagaceae bacterium]
MSRHHPILHRIHRFWKLLGPGLITGASDDDPSAITTFSQAGARYGLSTLWMAIAAFPFLAVLQETCARIGIVSGKGLTGVVKAHYPKWILYVLIVLSCPAFLFNIGADVAILGEVGHLLFNSIPAIYCSIGFTLILFVFMLLLSYKKLTAILKFLCLILLVYLVVPFLTSQKTGSIIRHSFIPAFHFEKNFLLTVIGLTGAIISPYIFFWQTSSEVDARSAMIERKKPGRLTFLIMRTDILSGAFFAVLIMYFIILTTGSILQHENISQINTVKDAAIALRPLAGNLSYILFSIGIIGTGFLIIPVLSSSISYIIMEAFDRRSGFSKSPGEVKPFYIIIGTAMVFGVSMLGFGISPVKALLFTTILYGFTAPFLIAIILHIANNKKIMGEFCNSRFSNIVGIIALILMLTTLIVFVFLML